jgi:hypothetical protein
MALIVILFCFVFEAVAQERLGTIAGQLLGPNDEEVPRAPVEAKNIATGRVSKAVSSASGGYSFSELPVGKYEISSPVVGFERKEAEVRPGESTRVDLRYKDLGTSLGTIGDSPIYRRLSNYNRPAAPAGKTPYTADGTPDLSGYWRLINTDAGKPEMMPWAEALAKYRSENETEAIPPGARCLPEDILRLTQLIQTRTYLLVLMESNAQSHRMIFLDGREHPKEPDPTWFGHAVGKWEKDTLIVDRVGFNEGSWLGAGQQGVPHTDMLHLIERYRRPDLGHLEVEITVDDGGAYVKPWTRKISYELQPNEEVHEYVCNENNLDPVNIHGK